MNQYIYFIKIHLYKSQQKDLWQKTATYLTLHNYLLYHSTRDVPKVMSNFVLHVNWEQQTKESAVVDGTSCCVILQCLVMSIACIT